MFEHDILCGFGTGTEDNILQGIRGSTQGAGGRGVTAASTFPGRGGASEVPVGGAATA